MQCSALNSGQCTAVGCTALHCSAIQCNDVQCSTMQCSAMQCSAVRYSFVLTPDFMCEVECEGSIRSPTGEEAEQTDGSKTTDENIRRAL